VRLEPDDDSGLSAEIVLGAFADDEAIAEAGANIINLGQAEGNMFAEGQVEAAADDEIERRVIGQLTEVDAFSLGGAGVIDVAENIVVSSSDHNFREGFEALHAKTDDWTDGVGEHGAADGQLAIREAVAALSAGGHGNVLRVGAVILKFGFEADVLEEVIGDGHAAAVQ